MSDEKKPSDREASSMADDKTASPVTPLLKWWVHYPAIIALAVGAFLWNPFGWETETANLSNDLIQRLVIGPFLYPSIINGEADTSSRSENRPKSRTDNSTGPAEDPMDPRQRMSTVVLFSDSDLKNFNTAWPMPLWVHAEILERILLNDPKGVFVDFVFHDKRESDGAEELLAVMKAYEEKKVPLWFARAEGPTIDRPIREDLMDGISSKTDAGLVSTIRPLLTSVVLPEEAGVARKYAPCSRPDKTRTSKHQVECLCVNAEGYSKDACSSNDREDDRALTAAFTMYEDARKNEKFLRLRRPTPLPLDMYIAWSNRRNAWNADHLYGEIQYSEETTCLPIEGSAINRLSWLGSKLWSRSSLRQPCPYSDTLRAGFLRSHLTHEDVRSRINNRYVFYGGDLVALGDIVNPPTHGRLPAVYHHAMALDNLLAYRGHYKHEQIYLFGAYRPREFIDLPLSILIAICVLKFGRNRQRVKLMNASVKPVSAQVMIKCMLGLATIATALAIYSLKAWEQETLHRTGYIAISVSFIALFLCAGIARSTRHQGTTKRQSWCGPMLIYIAIFLIAIFGAMTFSEVIIKWRDVALAAFIALCASLIVGLYRSPSPATDISTSQQCSETQTPGWRFLYRFWQRDEGWLRFLVYLSAMLIAVSAAMFEWMDIASRNWVWILGTAILTGSAVFNYWIERAFQCKRGGRANPLNKFFVRSESRGR